MVIITDGNILKANTDAIVNPINTQGTMGKGLALQFGREYPIMLELYKFYCKSKRIQIGKLFVYETPHTKKPDYIINFPTKDHWKNSSKITYISAGLISLKQIIIKFSLKSISIPALGCGLGGLNFNSIIRLIMGELNDIDSRVYLYKPIN